MRFLFPSVIFLASLVPRLEAVEIFKVRKLMQNGLYQEAEVLLKKGALTLIRRRCDSCWIWQSVREFRRKWNDMHVGCSNSMGRVSPRAERHWLKPPTPPGTLSVGKRPTGFSCRLPRYILRW